MNSSAGRRNNLYPPVVPSYYPEHKMVYIGLSLRGAKRRGNLIVSLMQRLLRSFQSLAMTLGGRFTCKLYYAHLGMYKTAVRLSYSTTS